MKFRIQSIIFLLTITFLICGCEINLSTATISNVRMCSQVYDNECPSDNPFFTSTTADIYVSCNLRHAPENTNVRFSWYYLADQEVLIDEVILSSGEQLGLLHLQSGLSKPNNAWPVGEYEVRIQIMGTEKAVIIKKFRIE